MKGFVIRSWFYTTLVWRSRNSRKAIELLMRISQFISNMVFSFIVFSDANYACMAVWSNFTWSSFSEIAFIRFQLKRRHWTVDVMTPTFFESAQSSCFGNERKYFKPHRSAENWDLLLAVRIDKIDINENREYLWIINWIALRIQILILWMIGFHFNSQIAAHIEPTKIIIIVRPRWTSHTSQNSHIHTHKVMQLWYLEFGLRMV